MKIRELMELSDSDLQKRMRELKENQFILRFQGATTPLDNPLLIRKNRREIARIMTILVGRRQNKEVGNGKK